jgi:hypothetical protein
MSGSRNRRTRSEVPWAPLALAAAFGSVAAAVLASASFATPRTIAAREPLSTTAAPASLPPYAAEDGRSPAFDPSHSAWTEILKARVKDGAVDYSGLATDRARLDAYLRSLESVSTNDFDAWSSEERLAFWVNAYNASTIRLVLDHHPVTSIQKIGGFFRSPFGIEFIPLGHLRGEPGEISLDDIEHETIRKDWEEPRAHFALVCASKSCPALRDEAFRGADLDRQLDEEGRRFLADPSKNRIDVSGRRLEISAIFKWFREDFEKAAGSVPAFLARFVDEPAASSLRDGGKWKIVHLDYDWSLNGK